SPEAWSAETTWIHLLRASRVNGRMIVESLLMATVAGMAATSLALVCCWLAIEARWFYTLLLGLMAAAWALPGPVIGIGLKETINSLMDVEETIGGLVGWPEYAP